MNAEITENSNVTESRNIRRGWSWIERLTLNYILSAQVVVFIQYCGHRAK